MNAFDYRKFDILFVDDEEVTRKYFHQQFSKDYKIWLARDGQEALEIFTTHSREIALIVTDQRMPGMSGVELLIQCREIFPDSLGILSTAYTDLEAAIEGINQGKIYQYVSKPWDINSLRVILRRAMDYFIMQQDHRQLMIEKFSRLQNLLISDRLMLLTLAVIEKTPRLPHSGDALTFYLSLCSQPAIDLQQETLHSLTHDFWRDHYQRIKSNFLQAVQHLAETNLPPETCAAPREATWSDVLGDLPGILAVTNDQEREQVLEFPRGKRYAQQCLELFFDGLKSCLDHDGLTVYVETGNSPSIHLPCDVRTLQETAGALIDAESSAAERHNSMQLFTGIFAAYSAGIELGFSRNNPDHLEMQLIPDFQTDLTDVNFVLHTLANDSFWRDILSPE